MLRLAILVAIVAVVALIAFKLVKALRGAGGAAGAERRGAPPAVEDAKLVRCGSCGAYVPRGDALPVSDGYRCGDARCHETPP